MPRRRLRLLPVLLGFLLLVGCGSDPRAVRESGPHPPTARAALGEFRDIDACSMADPAALREFGEVVRADTVSLDHCVVRVRTPDGSRIQLSVGDLADDRAEPGTPVDLRGPLPVEQRAPLPGHCERDIRFADGVAVRVAADLLAGRPGAGLCGIAQAGAEHAATVIARGEVEHRPYPPNSLALADPCAVLDVNDVRQIPGMERANARPEPAGHQCHWGERVADEPRVALTHTAGDPPARTRGTDVDEQVSGHRTVTGVVGGDPRLPLCSAETGHAPFGPPGSGQVEVAQLVVALPGSTGVDACEFARGLAERAWPHLPRA